MSFTLKDIDGAVVEIWSDDAQIQRLYDEAIDAQAAVKYRFRRKNLLVVLKRSEVGLVVKGYYDSHLWDEKFNEIADTIIAADKDIVEVEK